MYDQLMLQDCKGVMRAQVYTAQSQEEQKQGKTHQQLVSGVTGLGDNWLCLTYMCAVSHAAQGRRLAYAQSLQLHGMCTANIMSHKPPVMMHKMLWGCQQIYYL